MEECTDGPGSNPIVRQGLFNMRSMVAAIVKMVASPSMACFNLATHREIRNRITSKRRTSERSERGERVFPPCRAGRVPSAPLEAINPLIAIADRRSLVDLFRATVI